MTTIHPKKAVPNSSGVGNSVAVNATPNNRTLAQTQIKSVHYSDDSPQIDEISTQDICEIYSMLLPCLHLKKVMSSQAKEMVLKTYQAAMNIVIAKTKSAQSIVSKYVDRNGRKMNTKLLQNLISTILECKDCREDKCTGHKRVFMCLQCTNIGCFSEKHAYMHAKNTGHVFGIDPSNGELICFKCGDLISHELLEEIRYNALKEARLLDKVLGLPYVPFENNKDEIQLMQISTRLPSFKDKLGLRGFVNLGSTCFMSSVLQTILHNPYIRHYYLNGCHTQSNCLKSHTECMSCCLNQIFQDFYTNPTLSAYGLTSFIEAAWKVKRSLAGYSEQDAHEFWQFLVQQIHKSDTSSTTITDTVSCPIDNVDGTKISNNTSTRCDCIIHRTFSGTLQSTLTCTVCGSSRTIEDPMLDISLEVQDKIGVEKISLKDLHSCLKKYTGIEELDVLYECSQCQKRTKVTKSLKLLKLPPVLSIQLKRFEHIGVSSKIDYHINIPSVLDVENYTSNLFKDQLTTYELFGIICHIGNANTGHYIAYVKIQNGIWLKFDDAIVTRVPESVVKQANGYMLLYCAKDFS